jgi:hypothetical protein
MKFQWEVNVTGEVGFITSILSASAHCATTGESRVSCLQNFLHAFWSLILSDRVTKLLLGIVRTTRFSRLKPENIGEKW